jgi:putative transposase
MLWAWLARSWHGWRSAVQIVKPETIIGWHRRGFRLFWRWKSRRRTGRPGVPVEVRALIREMSTANPFWGAPRIHGELLKLGISVGQSTVAKYMRRRSHPPSQSWRTFLTNHASRVMAADLFVAPTVTFRLLFILVILAHDRRRIVHVAVTLLHDRDAVFADIATTIAGMGIQTVLSLGKDSPTSRPVSPSSTERVIEIPQVNGLHHRYECAAA